MPVALTDPAALCALPFDQIIDVRSPAEYAADHMPGAINLPALDDEERARVGTIYKQISPFDARKIGAALVAQNVARHLQGPLADRPGGWRPLVYCWRGGQRSGAVAVILQQIGWRAETVQGGYKSWRRLVVGMLHDRALPFRPVLIDGSTGTAKTRLLAHLAEAGAQVIDLEDMAQHRGSLFGGRGVQPGQKMLESRIALALSRFDPARPVYLEAEAAKIGNLLVPPTLWKAMLKAPRIELCAPVAARVGYLVAAYGDVIADPQRLSATLQALSPYHPAAQIAQWQEMARAGDHAALAEGLIRLHYDARYARAATRRAAPVAALHLPDLTDAALRAAAWRIMQDQG